MNIMLFLTPKSKVAFLEDDSTVRNGLEKMAFHRYGALPVVTSEGVYVGTVTEGDLLYDMMKNNSPDLRSQEKVFIKDIMRKGWNPPVRVTSTIEELFQRITERNFVPVVDDRDVFIGIVTRKDVIKFLCDSYFKK
ncbi:MAG: CBS domain-containing protein [Clostridiales bacterium]|nr:CBS domain-containing protein [Candidatus Coliplasma equi]